MGKDVYDNVPCPREFFKDRIPDHIRRNRRIDVKDDISVRGISNGDDCLCGSSRSNLLSHRYSAESVDAKGTAAHCEDSESKSSHCDSSHRKSSKGEQKSHGQYAKGENSCGDPAKREDARCDSAQGKNAGRDVPDRDDPFFTTVLLSGDPSSDIDV